jgi:hypothetical protein
MIYKLAASYNLESDLLFGGGSRHAPAQVKVVEATCRGGGQRATREQTRPVDVSPHRARAGVR